MGIERLRGYKHSFDPAVEIAVIGNDICRAFSGSLLRDYKGRNCHTAMLELFSGGRVAQLAEQCPFKAWVAGSNPAALTR